jgi:hypothetical protein
MTLPKKSSPPKCRMRLSARVRAAVNASAAGPAAAPHALGKRRRDYLSPQAVACLRKWLEEHAAHPYPTAEVSPASARGRDQERGSVALAQERHAIAAEAGVSVAQVTTWFLNTR